MELILYVVTFFVFGTVMGSFYNVVGYRLPNNLSIVKPASHCPYCNNRLKPFELIPIISYIFLGGKCHHCHKPISISYLLVELSTGLMFAASFLIFHMSMELFVALTFGSTLIIVIISDLKYMIIPDELLLFSGVLLFMERLFISSDFTSIVINAIVPFAALLLLKLFGDVVFKRESLGGGDIKLMVIFGLALGWPVSILSIFLAAIIALPISLVILKIKGSHILPFGPFLSMAALILYFTQFDISWLWNILM